MTTLPLEDAPATWRNRLERLRPGEELVITLSAQPLLKLVVAPAREPLRDHSAFLRSYAPEDEGLYDDDLSR